MSSTKRGSENVCAEPQNRETPTKKRRNQTEEQEEIAKHCSDVYVDGSKNCLNETQLSGRRDETLYLQIVYILVDFGTKVVLNLFIHLLKNENNTLVTFLTSPESQKTLKELKRKKILSEKEYRLSSGNGFNPKAEHFDISLLITLLQNLLPEEILPAPTNGWQKPPLQADYSLSADLLRLRKIRNEFVAHMARPQIPCFKYEKTRTELVIIFSRLTQTIEPHKEAEKIKTEITYKIDSYQVRVGSARTKEYKSLIKEWATTFNERVEMSLKTVNEFELYFTKRPKRYERYIKLLIEGGRKVLHGVLERECKKRNSSVLKYTNSLQSGTRMKYESILTDSKTSEYDVSKLATLLLEHFCDELNENEIIEIKKIQRAVEGHAGAIVALLDNESFTSLWTNLVSCIRCLSMMLDTEIKTQCDDLIETCSKDVEIDFKDLQRYCTNLKSLTNVYQDEIKQLLDLLTEMTESGIPFQRPQTLEIKIITLGENKEKANIAEKILYTVWKEALERVDDSTSFISVRAEVYKILSTIRSIPDVTDVSVAHKCIILGIQSDTPAAILELLSYLEKGTFGQCMNIVGCELGAICDEVFTLKSNFTLDSLLSISSNIQEKGNPGNQNGIRLPITCKSAAGLMEVWSLFQGKEMEGSTKMMAKSFSENLGQNIIIQTHPGFVHYSEETGGGKYIRIGDHTEVKECLTQPIVDDNLDKVHHDHVLPGQYASMMPVNMSTDSICGYYSMGDEYKTGGNKQPTETTKAEHFHRVKNNDRKNDQIQSVLHSLENTDSEKRGDGESTHVQTQISIGDCIRPVGKGSIGTVGPFVKIKETGEMCFLTIRHIFGRLEQPDKMFIGSKVAHRLSINTNAGIDRVCGTVIASEYNEYIDAALVKLSRDHIPNRYSFAAVNEEMFQAGSSAPKYACIHSNFEVENAKQNEIFQMQLIKVGNKTGWTKGRMLFTDGKVITKPETILYTYDESMIMEAVPYYGYIHAKNENGDAFAQKEDDGSPVYLLDTNGQLQCVGMLCCQMKNGDEYLIGQIDFILKSLGQKIGQTLVIDKFEQIADKIDPYDKELYNHTLKDGFEYDSQMRINIIGFFAQGKTTLTRRLLGEPLDSIACTDGIEIYPRKCKMHGKFWKTSNTTNLYDECSRRLVDVTNREHTVPLEFEEENVIDEIIDTPEGDEIRTFKGDDSSEQESSTKMNTECNKQFSEQQNKPANDPEIQLQTLFSNHLRDEKEINDQDVLLANIWDFGGQFIYYATHQIFHSRDAIYLLVFDLTKDLDTIIIDCDFPDRQEKMRNSLLFWVNSIHAFVGDDDSEENMKPTIILVGTHSDKVKGNVDSKFHEVYQLFENTKIRHHIYEKPFAVASLDKADDGIDNLKETIYNLGVQNAKCIKIPAKWIPLEIALLNIRDEKEKQILEFNEVVALDLLNTHPIADKNEIRKFLNYHHAKGTIIFFDEDGLDKYIVLNPQFMINAFRCIISAKWFCRWNHTVQINAKKLKREAILEPEFLDAVWKEDQFINFKKILLMFLEKHRILAELRQMDEQTGSIQLLGKYMIPSLLKPELSRHETNDFLQYKKYTRVILGLELEGLISTTVFEKCTAALLGKWPPIEYNDQVLVSQREGLYRLDLQHAGLIQKSGENIELMVINLCPPEHPQSTTCDRFRRYVEMVLTFEKRKNHLRQQGDVKPYRHYFKCNDSKHEGRGSHNVHFLDEIRNEPKVCCPDNRSHPIYVQEAIAEWFQGEGITDFETSIIRKASKNDKFVSRVAREFGINWKMFGIAIGLSFEDLKSISDECDQVKELKIIIIAMFNVWKEKYPDDSDYMHERENQIENNTGINVDWDKVRNCFDAG